MQIGAATRAATATKIEDAVNKSTQNQSLGQDAFLKLLVTQLTNQDPLAPQDQTQFLAQLAQFSTVEGVTNLKTNSDKTQAAELLGKNVDAYIVKNNVPTYVGGKVTGVRYDTEGIFLSVQGSSEDIKLSDVSKVY